MDLEFVKKHNTLSKYTPLSSDNVTSTDIQLVQQVEPPAFLVVTFPQRDHVLSESKEFFDVLLTWKQNNNPVVFNLIGELDRSMHANKFNGKYEFVIDLTDNGSAVHVIGQMLVPYLRSVLEEEYQQEVKVRNPIYKNKLTLSWDQEYGKYRDLELVTAKSIVAIHPDKNIQVLQQCLEQFIGQVNCRVVVKVFLRKDKATKTLSASLKFYVQRLQFK